MVALSYILYVALAPLAVMAGTMDRGCLIIVYDCSDCKGGVPKISQGGACIEKGTTKGFNYQYGNSQGGIYIHVDESCKPTKTGGINLPADYGFYCKNACSDYDLPPPPV